MTISPAVHARRHFQAAGQLATLGGTALRVLAQTKKAKLPFTSANIYAERLRFHCLRQDSPSPTVGAPLVTNGTMYTVHGVLPVDGEQDAYQTRWSLEVAWGPLISYTDPAGTAYSAKVNGAYSAAATAVNLSNVPAGLTATAVGDVFTLPPFSTGYTVANIVTAAAGVLTGVQFSPGLAQGIADQAAVSYAKQAATQTLRGMPLKYSTSEIDGVTILATDIRLIVLAAALTVVPLVGGKVVIDGLNRTVKNVVRLFYGESILAYEVQVG